MSTTLRAAVRQVGAREAARAAETLAAAFHDDPVPRLLAPREEDRSRVARWFYGTAVGYGLRWGQVWADEDVASVAVWLPPGNTNLTMPRMLRAGIGALPVVAGIRPSLRFVRGMSESERLHAAVPGPHWYLLLLGTRPQRRGRGLASALINAGTRQADDAGMPCYLETAAFQNLAFYERHGFIETGRVTSENATWFGMARQPRPPALADDATAPKSVQQRRQVQPA